MNRTPLYIRSRLNKSLRNMRGEVWLWVKGYENMYKVSSYARIKSVDRKVNHWRGGTMLIKGVVLSQIKRKNYLEVNLVGNNIRYARSIHQLVGEVFVSNPNNYPIINHEDGITINNLPYNLVWCNNSYNINHAYRTGLIKKKFGEDHHRSKLSNLERTNIVKLAEAKSLKYDEIAKMYNISAASVCLINQASKNKHVI